MTGFTGADVGQVRQLASRVRSQAGKLREIAISSTAALKVAEWTGNDIDQIRSNWNGKSLPRVRDLADAFDRLATELERNAAEQERVSGGGAPSGGDPWGRLREWLDDWWVAFPGIILPFLPGITGGGNDDSEPEGSPKPTRPPGVPKDEAAPSPPPSSPKGGDPGPASLPPGSGRDGYVGEFGSPPYPTYRGTPDNLGAFKGECTSWAAWRRKELGLAWRPSSNVGTGHGGEMAGRLGGSVDTPPTLGAVVSDPKDGHVMIVEEIRADGTIRVSEMNIGGVPGSVRTDRTWMRNADGSYSGHPWGGPVRLVFAP